MLEIITKLIEQRSSAVKEKRLHNKIINERINKLNREQSSLTSQLSIIKSAFNFVQNVSMNRRNSIKNKIETVLTESVVSIFGSAYKVQLNYEIKNNRSFCEINIVKQMDCGEVVRTIEGHGGSVADVLAVPLRMLLIVFSKEVDNVLILDEAYKHVSTKNIELIGKFLKDISEKLDLQIILCSHHEILKEFADHVVTVKHKH